MNDDDLGEFIDGYLDPPDDLNPDMLDVRIDWVHGDPRLGSRHMWETHQVTTDEVEEVLFEVPPMVEAKQKPDEPERTLFWGATRGGRWLLVVCEDWREGTVRWLRPITAFEPDEGRDYWEAW